MSENNIRKIPRILPSKIVRGGESKKIDDIIRDELDSDKIFFNKKVEYPNLRKMTELSNAYKIITDLYGKKSSESKKFRDICAKGEDNITIYYSVKKDTRYLDRSDFGKLSSEFVNNYRGKQHDFFR